jgi:hypothetical protein
MAPNTQRTDAQSVQKGTIVPANTADSSAVWNSTQISALARHEQELQRLHNEVALLRQHAVCAPHQEQHPPVSEASVIAVVPVATKQPSLATNLTRQANGLLKHRTHARVGKLPAVVVCARHTVCSVLCLANHSYFC